MAEDPLTPLQHEVLHLFFRLPESRGYVLAGGAALVATGLSDRPTQDVDLFGTDGTADIAEVADALEAACTAQGWMTQRIRDTATFRRLVVHAADADLLVDLAFDSPPLGALAITPLGPTYGVEELGARKLLALFDRAEARDFVDLQAIAVRLELDRLLALAAALDRGFDVEVLIEMLATHRRFTDAQLADLGADPTALRAFIDAWRSELTSRSR